MKAKRGKSVGSIHLKLKFRVNERRVDVRQKGREFSRIKRKATLDESGRAMTEPRYL